jgi:hypothetical protein
MKKLSIILATVLSSGSFANSYDCKTVEGHIAELSVSGRSLEWYEPGTSAGTTGELLGVDEARFGSTYGYLVYDLLDFYRSEDSHFQLKIGPAFNKKEKFEAILVFNRDDVESYETFACEKVAR